MAETLLEFPTLLSMAEFIFSNNISAVTIDSQAYTVQGEMAQADIRDAISVHDAFILIPPFEAPLGSSKMYGYIVDDDLTRSELSIKESNFLSIVEKSGLSARSNNAENDLPDTAFVVSLPLHDDRYHLL